MSKSQLLNFFLYLDHKEVITFKDFITKPTNAIALKNTGIWHFKIRRYSYWGSGIWKEY